MKRKVGKGVTQKILKKTRLISRALKFVGAPGSTLHNWGQTMYNMGYGKVARQYIRV